MLISFNVLYNKKRNSKWKSNPCIYVNDNDYKQHTPWILTKPEKIGAPLPFPSSPPSLIVGRCLLSLPLGFLSSLCLTCAVEELKHRGSRTAGDWSCVVVSIWRQKITSKFLFTYFPSISHPNLSLPFWLSCLLLPKKYLHETDEVPNTSFCLLPADLFHNNFSLFFVITSPSRS